MKALLIITLLLAGTMDAVGEDRKPTPEDAPRKAAPEKKRQQQGRRLKAAVRDAVAELRETLRAEMKTEIQRAMAEFKRELAGKTPDEQPHAGATPAELKARLANAQDEIARLKQQLEVATAVASKAKADAAAAVEAARKQAATARDEAAKALVAEQQARKVAEVARQEALKQQELAEVNAKRARAQAEAAVERARKAAAAEQPQPEKPQPE